MSDQAEHQDAITKASENLTTLAQCHQFSLADLAAHQVRVGLAASGSFTDFATQFDSSAHH